ncbi:MAG TPA: bifunctional 4-hydroxy-3-methylbut-2-enyl diphosphate reductase/30S ribosomal protein S1 [Ruminococcaceae bacterium]|nr:bifunctional 4-hydroxy-3-methylbut-2-enyl diphosphate reductase/30S ribosomal protein S1 [Oscillospiraceae bacterium]
MEIKVAASAGFCFGVKRAVELVEKLVSEGKKVCTLGAIIHNPQKVQELAEKGVRIVSAIEEVMPKETLVIRSHGVGASVIDSIEQAGIAYENATCPFVQKIHRIVSEHSRQGEIILIAGDKDHPEVQGIIGHCFSACYTFMNEEELTEIIEKVLSKKKEPVCVVVQTTFNKIEWKKSLKILQKVCTNAKIFDTICSATSDRQSEAEILASESDLMLVIGGRHSSNTNKLFQICRDKCSQTYLIETAGELPVKAVTSAHRIGITAGASTPASIIKEVLVTMTEEIKNITESEAEENFKTLYEESVKEDYNTDGRVVGVVVGITPTEVYVDVGRKQQGIVPLAELSADPNAKTEDLVKIGDELNLKIMKTNDQEGTMLLSKRLLDAQKGWDEIVKAEEEQTILTGVVNEVVKGGVVVMFNGVRVFIPASLATATRGEPLEQLLKQEVRFRIIETTGARQRKRAVGSIRAVLAEERKAKAAAFWAEAEVGKKYVGTVKSLTSYGAFVDIGGIDGMVHISELSWGRVKHPSEVVNVGDTVEVYIKALDTENNKISLGYRKPEDNPLEILRAQYPVGTVCEVEIVGLTPFGAFARILPGIDGLIHVSQISNERIEKPQDVLSVGQKVTVKITAIDFETKRISLSMKAALENDEDTQAAEE